MNTLDFDTRFFSHVDGVAPRPGHLLTTLHVTLGQLSIINWMIEGPVVDAVTMVAQITDFSGDRPSVTYDKYVLQGPLLQRTRGLDYSPATSSVGIHLQLEDGLFRRLDGMAVFSSVRAPNGIDPDAVVASFATDVGLPVTMVLTNVRRAFTPLAILAKAAIALGAAGCSSSSNKTIIINNGGDNTSTVTQEGGGAPQVTTKADLALTDPRTGINSKVRGGVTVGPPLVEKLSGGVAPVSSTTPVLKQPIVDKAKAAAAGN